MRPKLLKMTAFGPYGGEQIIDFTQLEDANMFLIYGPTGGGKTTILDAICYALYGETNGGERSGENMRSKFAEEGVITEVELFFKLRNEEYRIIRRPQYERAPKKGKSDKLIKVPAEVELYKKEDGEYKIITSKYNEAGEQINKLLHFNIGQFRQVIMIAQNKFRELLTVSSKERQQILQDIFETGIYQNVEKALDRLSANAKDELHDQEANYKAIMDTIAPNDHEMLNTYMQTKVIYNAPEVCEILETICKTKHNEKEKIEAKLLEVGEAITKAQEELARLTQMANDTAEKLKLEEHLEFLKEQEAGFKALKTKVDLAEKAKGIIPLEEVVMKLAEEVFAKQKDQEKYEEELKATEEHLKAKEEELKLNEKLIDEAAELRKDVNVLETYVPKVLELNEAYKRESDLKQQLDKYERGYKKLEETVEAVKTQIKDKQEEVKEKSQLQKKSTELYMLQREMEDVLKLMKERASREHEAKLLFNNLQGMYKEIEAQDKVYNACESEYRNAFSIWFNGQAAELAQALDENSPCPVCGSLHHPKKAVLTDNHVTKEELEKIETAKKQAEARLAKLKQESAAQEAKCTEVKNQIDGYNEKLKEKGNITEESKQKLDNDIEILKSKLSRLEELEKSLEEDNKKLKEAEERKENGKNFIEKAKLDLNEQKAAIKSVEKDVPEALRNQEALEKKIEVLKREYELKEKVYKELGQEVEDLRNKQAKNTARLEETKKHLEELKKQGTKQKETLNGAILAAGFEDKEAYKASKLSDLEIEDGKKQVETYTHDQVVSKEKYKALQEKTKEFKQEDLKKAKETNEKVLAENTSLNVEKTKLEQYLQTHERIIENLKEIYGATTALLKRQRILEKISTVAKGKNPKGLSFERYIQSSIFEEVLVSANKKLKPMTLNRYELYRTDDLSRANAQVGLDIGIKDYYSNETRPVNTLSGGESFMAALALALGLSEVIQRLAGATPLDTLFIDEGFGSLDEEALEMAIKVLLNIQDTGRLIGIISHVRELREQIPVGLEVTTGPTGSKAVFRL